MTCTGCGLSLSPQRTHCPQCGKVAGELEDQNQLEVPQYNFPSFPEQDHVSTGVDALQQQADDAIQQQTSNEIADHLSPSFETEQSPDQRLISDQNKTLPSTPTQQGKRQLSQSEQKSPPSGEFRPFPQPPRKTGQRHSRHTLQPGFTIAGLCVSSGGLILLLVYIISLRLPPLSTTNQPVPVVINTPISPGLLNGHQRALQAHPTSPPTTKTAPSLLGKAYIDNAQTGSSINYTTAQLYQITTNFTVNQKIFVTFMLHPVNSGGAVCLLWYVNQQQFSQFTFAIGSIPQQAYSFASSASPGQGSVAIYWASSTACTDKMLAQVVNFTVTP